MTQVKDLFLTPIGSSLLPLLADVMCAGTAKQRGHLDCELAKRTFRI
jgi:hypothetical protein